MRTWVCAGACLATLASTTAVTQTRLVDDAKRNVQLPARISRVFAAGAPAEVLLYTLVPEMLAGRNRLPEGAAIEFFPPAYRTPVFIKQLPEVDNPAADAVNEQRRSDRRQRDREREDLNDDELGAELARGWHGAPGG